MLEEGRGGMLEREREGGDMLEEGGGGHVRGRWGGMLEKERWGGMLTCSLACNRFLWRGGALFIDLSLKHIIQRNLGLGL